jgi:polyisoprenoid-binding protein YceI
MHGGPRPPISNITTETFVTRLPTDSTRPASPPAPDRRWLAIGLAVVAIAFLAGGALGFSYLFLRPQAPAAVGLSTATPAATQSPAAATDEASAGPSVEPTAAASSDPAAGDGLAGTWSVDPSIGSFGDFSGSFVGYRVREELANVGAATAVGRTPDVGGSLTLQGTTITAVEITADLSTLQSDNDMRDGQLRRQALETGTYPEATFVLAEPVELGALPAEGEVVAVTAAGDLTIHGRTQSVEIPLEARFAGDVVTVTGSLEIEFADYDIAQPQSFMVLSIDDRGTMEFQLQFTRI